MEAWKKALYFTLQLKLIIYSQSVFKQGNIKNYLKSLITLYYLDFHFIAFKKKNQTKELINTANALGNFWGYQTQQLEDMKCRADWCLDKITLALLHTQYKVLLCSKELLYLWLSAHVLGKPERSTGNTVDDLQQIGCGKST